MKRAKRLIVLAEVATVAAVLVPGVVFAQSSFDGSCLLKGGCWGPLTTCTGDYAHVTQPAPGAPTATCQSLCDFAVLLDRWIFFMMSLILYYLVPIGFAIAAIMLMVSAGSPSRITRAKEIFRKTLFGLLLAAGASLLIGTFVYFLGNPDLKDELGNPIHIGWPNIECSAKGFYNVPTPTLQPPPNLPPQPVTIPAYPLPTPAPTPPTNPSDGTGN